LKNLITASCTILLLIFTSCEKDFVKDSENIGLQAKNGTESLAIFNYDRANDNPKLQITDSKLETGNEDLEINTANPTIEIMRDDKDIINVGSLNLACVPNSKFVVRATYNDLSNSLSFEYFDNSANESTIEPIGIKWSINNGIRALPLAQSGSSAEDTDFAFDNNYHVTINITFDDDTTFEDEFCLNIDKANPTAFNVCSDHESTVGCIENAKGGNKKALVIVDMVL